jgi:hypothetical protein
MSGGVTEQIIFHDIVTSEDPNGIQLLLQWYEQNKKPVVLQTLVRFNWNENSVYGYKLLEQLGYIPTIEDLYIACARDSNDIIDYILPFIN